MYRLGLRLALAEDSLEPLILVFGAKLVLERSVRSLVHPSGSALPDSFHPIISTNPRSVDDVGGKGRTCGW